MDFFVTIKVALKSLMRNKMRTFLTMLGIVIGVGAVITMLSIGKGAEKSITEDIESGGTNFIVIFASSSKKGGLHGVWGSINTLTIEDADAIAKQCRHIQYVTPVILSTAQLIYRDNNWNTQLMAVNPDFQYIRNWNPESGRYFTQAEMDAGAKVALIGQTIKTELFADKNPIGEIIRVNKMPFKVIGVLEARGRGGGPNQRMDEQTIIPFSTAQQRFYKKNYITAMFASSTTREDTDKAVEEVTRLLRQRHHLKEGDDDDFVIRTQKDMLEVAQTSLGVFTILLGAIASISLIVGGIGIMNIMLVSVTERIREIGIRMAVGAKSRDIMLQFLVESIVLALLGGLVGILLGSIASVIFAKVVKWKTFITISSIIISIFFSCAVGVFFGFYPAWKASRLNPIEALRQE